MNINKLPKLENQKFKKSKLILGFFLGGIFLLFPIQKMALE